MDIPDYVVNPALPADVLVRDDARRVIQNQQQSQVPEFFNGLGKTKNGDGAAAETYDPVRKANTYYGNCIDKAMAVGIQITTAKFKPTYPWRPLQKGEERYLGTINTAEGIQARSCIKGAQGKNTCGVAAGYGGETAIRAIMLYFRR